MRDPKRMEAVLQKLGELWAKYPDWRLMQLICNMQSATRNDMFYLEDDRFIEALELFIKEGF